MHRRQQRIFKRMARLVFRVSAVSGKLAAGRRKVGGRADEATAVIEKAADLDATCIALRVVEPH